MDKYGIICDCSDPLHLPFIECRIIRHTQMPTKAQFFAKQPVKTLIDTGSNHSFINKRLIEEYGLVETGKNVPTQSSSLIEQAKTYCVDLLFPDGTYIQNIEVAASDTAVDFILGNDVLRLGELTLSWTGDTCHIRFLLGNQ